MYFFVIASRKERAKQPIFSDSDIPMHEGFHHVNDMVKVVEQQLPEAKMIMQEKLDFTETSKAWFEPLHMTHVAMAVYEMKY